MVDCRSLIEFCRAFERHRNTASIRSSSDQRSRPGGSGSKRCKSLNPLFHPFCEHSPFAAIDVVMVILVIGALAVLTIPYFNSILRAASEFFPEDIDFVGDVIYQPIVAYSAASVLLVAAAIAAWEVISHQLRKCGNPFCRGLRKAVEFDIQLEPEECVKYLPTALKDEISTRHLELGEDHKELEAELKKMAPPNGRTVLIFRAPCGCPEGRMEVWGPKKVRRIKKKFYQVRSCLCELSKARKPFQKPFFSFSIFGD